MPRQVSLTVRTKTQLLFTSHFAGILNSICTNVLREICSYIGSFPRLPIVSASTLLLYDLQRLSFIDRKLTHEFKRGASFCLLTDTNLLGVGGCSGVNVFGSSQYESEGAMLGDDSVVNVHLADTRVNCESPMVQKRAWAGVVRHYGYIYVFGGAVRYSRATSEKYCLYSRSWTIGAEMICGRSHFTPCSNGNIIYLPGGNSRPRQLEAFDTVTEQYRLIVIEAIPGIFQSVACVCDGELLLYGEGEELRVDLQKEIVVGVKGNVRRLSCAMAPVRVGEWVYFAGVSGDLQVLDGREKKFVAVGGLGGCGDGEMREAL